ISFTGSAAVGRRIRQMAGNKAVTLELGGNAALIVDQESRPLAEIADRTAFGAFSYAGQTCISVQRILIREDLKAAFLPLLIQATRALKVGDPMSPETLVGAMIHMSAVQRARGLIKEALQGGANVLYGGNTFNALTLNPTLLDRTTPEMAVNA